MNPDLYRAFLWLITVDLAVLVVYWSLLAITTIEDLLRKKR